MRLQILEELDQLEREAPGSTAIWSPQDERADHDLRVREARYLIERGLIRGMIGGDHWISARILSDGRDHLEQMRSARMATVVKVTIPAPHELPTEWKELVRGIAARHELNAEPHLTPEGIYLVLTTFASGEEIQEAVSEVRDEIEHALAQPSRVRSAVPSSNVFVNHGQAAAMGPNAVASGNTFQQLVNVQRLEGDEQKRWNEQLDRLFQAVAPEATDPDHYTALAEVKRAQLAAKVGDRSGVISALKKAGKWAYDIAEKIGVEVVAGLIKDGM